MADTSSLSTLKDKIELVLTRTDADQGKHLVASHTMNWRMLLCESRGLMTIPVELNGTGAESKVPVGILDVKMEFLPKLEKVLASDVVSKQNVLEKSRFSERERLFLIYTKQWWKEYLGIRGDHSNRLVKIFAQDENGTHHPVCRFIQPINTNRLIDSPRQAARFVSLFGYEKSTSLGSTASEMWTGLHAFLCRGKGDAESHASLLCSLLIGFGLNAFVCIGTKAKGLSHAWVATIGDDNETVFWESLTAERFIHQSVDPCAPPLDSLPPPQHPYKTIGCIFNHEMFFANCQSLDHVDTAVFNLHNEALWKAMSGDAIRSITPNPALSVPLMPSSLDAIRLSDDCERQLKSLVAHHRKDLGLPTTWDDRLSHILGPALSAYELQHAFGLSLGNEEFQHAVRHHVPNGHTFKAFPIQFTNTNARMAFAHCLRSAVCEEIIRCRGDAVRHAVRVKIVAYPERLCAMWIMMAVQYRNDGSEDWGMIELQGVLENKEESGFENVHIGDLHYDITGCPYLIIGHHLLVGSIVSLEKPFAVLEKCKTSDDVTMAEDDCMDSTTTNYNVVAFVTKKIIFKTRPRPIISKVMPIVK